MSENYPSETTAAPSPHPGQAPAHAPGAQPGPPQPGHAPAHHEHPRTAIEKEFELERVILFSDAVFAIAITLLVIDIKFPEIPEHFNGTGTLKLFRNTIFEFVAFAVSFFFIGRSWILHLRLFRMLRKYDQRLVNLNLLALFFIVMFPFTASGMSGHVRNEFLLPVFLYVFNLTLVSFTQFLLCRHVIYGKNNLSIDGEEDQKKYTYIRSLYNLIAMSFMSFLVVLAFIVFPGRPEVTAFSCAFTGIFFLFARRMAHKYGLKKSSNEPTITSK